MLIVAILVVGADHGLQRGLLASLGTILGRRRRRARRVLAAAAGERHGCRCRSGAVRPWSRVGVGLLVIGGLIGSAIGAAARRGVDRTPLKGFERFLGGVASVVVAALMRSRSSHRRSRITGVPAISAAIVVVAGAAGDRRDHPGSGRIDRSPSCARPSWTTDCRRSANCCRTGGVEAAPPVALDDPELQAAAASVARISGVAYACGTGATGSGFVIAPDRLITNAHVVAGVDDADRRAARPRGARGTHRVLRPDRRPRRDRRRRPRRHAPRARARARRRRGRRRSGLPARRTVHERAGDRALGRHRSGARCVRRDRRAARDLLAARRTCAPATPAARC